MISTNTLADNKTTSTATSYTLDYIQSTCTGIYYNPYTIQYDPCNYTITASAWPTKLETDSNELKINIKKFQIKFNFNL